MTTPPDLPSYMGYRFPAEIISYTVWLYFRFSLSYRDVEELLGARGVLLTYETVRQWCHKFGQHYANQLRRRRAQTDQDGTGSRWGGQHHGNRGADRQSTRKWGIAAAGWHRGAVGGGWFGGILVDVAACSPSYTIPSGTGDPNGHYERFPDNGSGTRPDGDLHRQHVERGKSGRDH